MQREKETTFKPRWFQSDYQSLQVTWAWASHFSKPLFTDISKHQNSGLPPFPLWVEEYLRLVPPGNRLWLLNSHIEHHATGPVLFTNGNSQGRMQAARAPKRWRSEGLGPEGEIWAASTIKRKAHFISCSKCSFPFIWLCGWSSWPRQGNGRVHRETLVLGGVP